MSICPYKHGIEAWEESEKIRDIELKRFFKKMPKGVPSTQTDMLTEIFDMQRQLDDRITTERGIEKTISEWVIGLTIAIESEIDEMRREVDWKWWKNPQGIDEERLERLQGEVIDVWHFLPSLSLKVGLTADDVHRLYMEKNAENHARQNGDSDKEGYAITKEGE